MVGEAAPALQAGNELRPGTTQCVLHSWVEIVPTAWIARVLDVQPLALEHPLCTAIRDLTRRSAARQQDALSARSAILPGKTVGIVDIPAAGASSTSCPPRNPDSAYTAPLQWPSKWQKLLSVMTTLTGPRDIYELLEQVRKLPGMYFGRAGSIPLLDAFLVGTKLRPMRPEEPSLCDFDNWLAARIDALSDSHNMVRRWFEEEFGPEKAFDIYFQYLDEYRANEVELLYVNEGSFKRRSGYGGGRVRTRSMRLVVGRFLPSEVYFWGEQSGVQLAKIFPFCHTVAKAKRLAAERWETPPRSWRKLGQSQRPEKRPPPGLWSLLERVRQRSGMYCDPKNRPLVTLETLLCGYEAALADYDVLDEGNGFSAAFRLYLLVRFGWSTACGWAVAIRDHLKAGEDELARFFELVDEFREVVAEVSLDLVTVGARLDDISLRVNGVRRRRRDWVVEQLRWEMTEARQARSK